MDRKVLILFITFAVFSVFVLYTGHGRAAAGCAPNIGKRVPVELVHGWSSDGGMWKAGGSDSMINALNKLSNVYVDTPFNYSGENQEWVTQNIGPALAARIACLAQSSKDAGGLGKVIVIAHSMGGLATRYASSLTVDKQNVGNDIGLVITLGTPNTGTDFASAGTKILGTICEAAGLDGNVSGDNICALTAADALQNNSPELRILPWLPTNTAVHSIAGDVTVDVPLFYANIPVNTDSDLAVGEGSALKGSAHPEEGGGQTVVACSASIQSAIADFKSNSSLIPCWHSALPHNPTVEQLTANSIEAYINANQHRSSPIATALPQTLNKSSSVLAPYAGTYYQYPPDNTCGGASQSIAIKTSGYAVLTDGHGKCPVVYNSLYTLTATKNGLTSTLKCNDSKDSISAAWAPSDFKHCNAGYGTDELGDIVRITTPGVLSETYFHLTGLGNYTYYWCAANASNSWKQKCYDGH